MLVLLLRCRVFLTPVAVGRYLVLCTDPSGRGCGSELHGLLIFRAAAQGSHGFGNTSLKRGVCRHETCLQMPSTASNS